MAICRTLRSVGEECVINICIIVISVVATLINKKNIKKYFMALFIFLQQCESCNTSFFIIIHNAFVCILI